MNTPPCGIKLKTFKIRMRKRVNITYTAISPGFIFVLRYQHQVLKLISLGAVQIIPSYQFTWVNEPWNTAHKTHLPKKSVFCMVKTLGYQIFSTLLYWGRRKKIIFENIIVDTVSSNICPLCSTYFYVNLRTKLKCKNILVGTVTHFKIIHNNPNQWPLYFWLYYGTIAPKITKWTMIFLQI